MDSLVFKSSNHLRLKQIESYTDEGPIYHFSWSYNIKDGRVFDHFEG